MKLKLTNSQIEVISKYLADISKLTFAATVLGFFIPVSAQLVSLSIFLGGIVITAFTFTFSVHLIK